MWLSLLFIIVGDVVVLSPVLPVEALSILKATKRGRRIKERCAIVGRISNNNNDEAAAPCPPSPSFDRFHAQLYPSVDVLREFDPTLPLAMADSTTTDELENSNSNNRNDVWVAVYRSTTTNVVEDSSSSSVMRDEFLHAMRSATELQPMNSAIPPTPASLSSSPIDDLMVVTSSSSLLPVAVARLTPSPSDDIYDGTYILDSMRCILEKEKTDPTCDGGSEHAEAIGTAIDSLLLHYVSSMMKMSSSTPNDDEQAATDDVEEGSLYQTFFDNAIRTKATLVSGPLLEDRGFRPVTELKRDMTTHISSLDECLERYAMRLARVNISPSSTSSASGMSPSARRRALEIVSYLGRLNRDDDIRFGAAAVEKQSARTTDDDSEYDPWAGIRQFV